MEIRNLDQVIQHATEAVDASSNEVRRALGLVVQAETLAERANAAEALRIALVAQASGFECGAHDGATFVARKAAAKAALAAWDESRTGEYVIEVGSTRITTTRELWDQLCEYHTRRGLSEEGVRAVAAALAEGLIGEAAVLRAVAIAAGRKAERQAQHAALEVAKLEAKAADDHARAAYLQAKSVKAV